MGLKLLKDGMRVRKAWYCQYMDQGKWRVKKLTTPMRGQKIPSVLTDMGDAAFERSRALAQQEFEKFEADRKIKGTCEHLTEALIKSKSGQKVEYVTLAELPERWANLPRTYTPPRSISSASPNSPSAPTSTKSPSRRPPTSSTPSAPNTPGIRSRAS